MKSWVTAELRTSFRSAFTWISIAAAVGLGFGLFLYYSFVHGIGSGHTATIGGVAPRFLIHVFGSFSLLVALYLTGSAFLYRRHYGAADDQLVYARPISNASIVLGWLVAYSIVAWLAMGCLALLVQLYGALSANFDLLQGGGAEWSSLLQFLLIEVPLASLFFGSLVIVVSTASRTQWIAYLILTCAWLAHVVLLFVIPQQYWTLTFLPLFGQISSDWFFNWLSGTALTTNAAYFAFTIGFVLIAAIALSRREVPFRKARTTVGACTGFVLGAVTLVANAFAIESRVEDESLWREAQRQVSGSVQQIDLNSLSGTVQIEPGTKLIFDVALAATVLDDVAVADLVLSLNPGMRVDTLTLNGVEVRFDHRAGRVVIREQHVLRKHSELTLRTTAHGIPHNGFAYFDSTIEAGDENMLSSRVHALGTRAMIFEDSYVALTDKVAWLPKFGVHGYEQDKAQRDSYDMNLTVFLPESFHLVGTGHVEEQAHQVQGTRRWSFRTEHPTFSFGIFAAEFVRYSDNVADIEFEVFLHPNHLYLVAFLRDKYKWLRTDLRLRLERLREEGLEFPFTKFSLIEVPGSYRAFGGGILPDSTLGLPSAFLMREYDLPTSRFDHRWRMAHFPEGTSENIIASAFAYMWSSYFENDRNGSDIFDAFARSYFAHTTCVEGEFGEVLEDLLHSWFSFRVNPTPSIFSARAFVPGQLRKAELPLGTVGIPLLNAAMVNTADVQVAVDVQSKRPRIWEIALSTALLELSEASKVDATLAYDKRLRATMLSIDALVSRESWLSQVEQAKARYGTRCIPDTELLSLSPNNGLQHSRFLQNQLERKDVSKFVMSDAIARPVESGGGLQKFNTTVHLRNDSSSMGQGELELIEQATMFGIEKQQKLGPISLAPSTSVAVVLESETVPLRVIFTPLSLSENRFSLHSVVTESDAYRPEEQALGIGESKWVPFSSSAIVIDDLDADFALVQDAKFDAMSEEHGVAEWDLGLPSYRTQGHGSFWSRVDFANSWGRYRRTHAYAMRGDGNWKVQFNALLPKPGIWQLEYHLPVIRDIGMTYGVGTYPLYEKRLSYLIPRIQGKYEMTLIFGSNQQKLFFDASNEPFGWQVLGSFELSAGNVTLEVTNRTTGEIVYADAVRWSKFES